MTTVTESNLEEFKTLENLEASVQRADSKLDLIVWKLDQFEKDTAEEVNNESSNGQQPGDEATVIKLLQGVNQVKEEYENLRREINEVQQLQRQLTDSLRNQLKQVQGRFGTLRERLISNPHVAMAVCDACFTSKKTQPNQVDSISNASSMNTLVSTNDSTPIISLSEPPTQMTSATDISTINIIEPEEEVMEIMHEEIPIIIPSPREFCDLIPPMEISTPIPIKSHILTTSTAAIITSTITTSSLRQDDSSDDDDGGFKSRASFRL